MSLFASAFDTGAGPSNALLTSSALGKPHKDGKQQKHQQQQQQKQKKRPSLPNHGLGQHNLKATEANLAKLMKKVEAGEVKGKREGGESMGGGGKGKKGKRKGGEQQEEDSTGAAQQMGGEGKKRKRESMLTGAASASTSTPTKSKSEAPIKIKKGERPPPAELPLPHAIPKSDLHSEAVKDEKLTDMQRSMQAKLEGARFRWINEQLYSNPSVEAVAMMKKEPKIFEDYHQTHRALTSAWPSPPLPHLITLLSPLPAKTLIVDLGCGDAGLAKALVPQGKIVLSYDLVGDSGNPAGPSASSASAGAGGASASGGWVCEADFLSHVPLPGRPGGISVRGATTMEAVGEMSKSQKRRRKAEKARDGSSEVVDVVVCCLSLMGTNWVGGIYEACRVLKQGGTLHIAEVTSRFVSTESFTEKVCSFGFILEDQSQPSTHFTLFKFTKEADVPLGPARGERGWDERVREGEEILRGCVYKKR